MSWKSCWQELQCLPWSISLLPSAVLPTATSAINAGQSQVLRFLEKVSELEPGLNLWHRKSSGHKLFTLLSLLLGDVCFSRKLPLHCFDQ